MNREEKIKAIYEEMANTDTTIGCRVQIEWFGKMLKGTILDGTNILREDGEVEENCILRNVEIIGHPVMIGDVIDYTGEKKIDIVWSNSSCVIDIRDGEKSLNLFNLWDNKRTPIEDQSDECIDFIYSLIGNKNE